MTERRRRIGRQGEQAAERFLERRGFRIVARNWSCRFGELDLVALDRDVLVFVEVKVRSGRLDPFEAVDERKQRHLSRVAFDFLKRHGMLGRPARFDVVAVDGKTLECTHVADAFDVALDY